MFYCIFGDLGAGDEQAQERESPMPISHLNVTMSCRTCIRAGVLGVLGQECKYDRVSELRDSSGAAEGQADSWDIHAYPTVPVQLYRYR